MCQLSERHLRRHGIEPATILGSKLAQMVAIPGNNRVNEAISFGFTQRREIGFAEAFEIFPALLSADSHGLAPLFSPGRFGRTRSIGP